ncbi:MAG: carboxymuconolactone decarboxylase family protein [Candidatus Hadarchaeota archaeon]
MKETVLDFQDTMKHLMAEHRETTKKFRDFKDSAMEAKVLDDKSKQLVALGAAITAGCKYCIGLHVKDAFRAGATKEEIYEAALVAVLMGGSPALTYVTDVKQAVEEYSTESTLS